MVNQPMKGRKSVHEPTLNENFYDVRFGLYELFAENSYAELNSRKELEMMRKSCLPISSIIADFVEFPVEDGRYDYKTNYKGVNYSFVILISTEADSKYSRRKLVVMENREANSPCGTAELIVNSDSKTKELRFAVYRMICQLISPSRKWKDCISCRKPLYECYSDFLKSELVLPLETRDARYPRACYYCRPCKKYLNSVEGTIHHCSSLFHQKAKKRTQQNACMYSLPAPSAALCSAVAETLNRCVQQFGLSGVELQECRDVVSLLEILFQELLSPHCKLRLTGSVLSQVALKTSDINVELVLPEVVDVAEVGRSISSCTVKNKLIDGFLVNKDNKCTFFVKHRRVCMTLKSEERQDVHDLMRIYTSHYEPLRILAIALRKWARDCCLITDTMAGLAPYVLDLMLVHFLQQRHPELVSVSSKIKFDCRDGFWILSDAPFEHEADSTSTKWDIGFLWIECLRYYAVEFKFNSDVVHVLPSASESFDDKEWHYERLAVEDPFAPNENAVHLLESVACYFLHCLRCTYKYFTGRRSTCDCVAVGGEDIHLQREMPTNSRDSKLTPGASDIKVAPGVRTASKEAATPAVVAELVDACANLSISGDHTSIKTKSSRTSRGLRSDDHCHRNKVGNGANTNGVDHDYCNVQEAEDLNLEFSADNFGIEQMPIILRDESKLSENSPGARRRGRHKRGDCETDPPRLSPLPQMEASYLNLLDYFFFNIAHHVSMPPDRLQLQEVIRQELEVQLQLDLQRNISLRLFGSSLNGFGFQNSDLDLCLTFRDEHGLQNSVKPRKVIHEIAKSLRLSGMYSDVTLVLNARVPVVKFVHKETEYNGDICLENKLALRNTQLLSTYSRIDYRAKVLGLLVKTIAKFFNICDASRGSLSSYAYIVMVIHYLQNVTPPVLPILQELPEDTAARRQVLIDGHETYFFDDLNALPTVWPGMGKNISTLTELFIGFFSYYLESFDTTKMVVRIHAKSTTHKFKHLLIEDPFDHRRNLASSCSNSMLGYIFRRFAQTRVVFADPAHQYYIQRCPTFYHLLRYFFDCHLNCDELRPTNNVCWHCRHIGHAGTECQALTTQQVLNEFFSSSDDESDDADASPSISRSNGN